MTFIDKFISITDIRKNASFYINNINESGEKIIFVNNKPKAVLLDIKLYERFLEDSSGIEFKEIEGSREELGTDEHKKLLSLMKKA